MKRSLSLLLALGCALGGVAGAKAAELRTLHTFGPGPLYSQAPLVQGADGDNWLDDSDQAAQLTASGLAPTHWQEAGIRASLPLGPFTAILAGQNGGTGIGLVEIYNLH